MSAVARVGETLRGVAGWGPRVRDFALDVQAEMKRVTWPTWPELRSATFVILIFIVIVALIIGFMDWVFRNVVGGIVNVFTG